MRSVNEQGSRMLGRAGLEALDGALAERSRAQAALGLRLGQLLEVLGRGACLELGFSSLSAYALERAARRARWVEGARCLARRLESLPRLRSALAFGHVGWSVAELLSRVASPESEAAWLAVARRCTVRELRARLREGPLPEGPLPEGPLPEGPLPEGPLPEGPLPEGPLPEGIGPDERDCAREQADESCTLTFTVDREDAWLFESTRALLEALGARGASEQIEALLAEGQESLLARLLPGGADLGDADLGDDSQALEERRREGEHREQMARWREEAEVACESRLVPFDTRGTRAFVSSRVAREAAGGLASIERWAPARLDSAVRELVRAVSCHELDTCRMLLRFHRADGWRRLGYATEAQYVRERLGVSRSSAVARRALALRLESLPTLAGAFGRGEVGLEAATSLSRIATARTEGAWVERALRRTVKHLREEVEAALTAVRLSGERDCPPPLDSELDAFHELERIALGCARGARTGPRATTSDVDGLAHRSGSVVASARGPGEVRPEHGCWRVTLESLGEWLDGWVARPLGSLLTDECAPVALPRASGSLVQTSAGPAGRCRSAAGRVTLRLRVASDVRDWFRALEQQARRWLPRGVSFLRFLCGSIWRAWQHLLGVRVAYGGIYVRDRHRCTSPACHRRDVTPHHLRFRSAGGGDEDDNVVAVCTWCHLLGIHGGRIRARGTAGRVRWELGRGEPCLVVEGRDKAA